MKKTYKSSLLALSVLASFTSCSESESLQQANLSKDKITFHATLDNTWKPLSPASSSRAAIAAATEKGPIVVPTPFGKPLYLHPVVQDGIHIWSKEGKPITRSGAPLEDVEHERVVQTRGTMSTKTDLSDYQSFGVTAIYKNGENNVSLFQEENGEPKIAIATSTTEDKVWEIKDSRWPVGSEVSFHAFAPYSAGSTSPLSFKPDVDGEKTLITYTASATDIVNQPDLILATAKGSQSDNALGLNFSHALTAVTFAIDKDLADVLGAGKKLTSITLSGIPNEGTYDLAVMKGEGNAAPEWQLVQDGAGNNTGTYTFDLKDQDIVTGKDFALTSDNNTLMMIPQTLPETAKLNFQFELDGVLQSLIIDMKDQVWQPGKSVIYKLSASAINSLTNTEVVYPSTWNAVGYPKQAFAKDEAIGLFAVSQDKKITAKNVKLVKYVEDGNEIWKTSDGNKFLRTANYKYFAYYPYDANLSEADLDVNAETADAFFAKKITSWNPVENQNTKDILLKQDFQVAEGVVTSDASTLTFNMTHSMALAVIELGNKEIAETRTFSKNESYTYFFPGAPERVNQEPVKGTDYTDNDKKVTILASSNFTSHKPYYTNNSYIQIIKPNTDVSFKADDEENNIRSSWGSLYTKNSTFNLQANVAKKQTVTTDADFYYLKRYYGCTNNIQQFNIPISGQYQIQCWGAKGSDKGDRVGGKGGYCKGTILLDKTKAPIYVYVGAMSGGFGGGGKLSSGQDKFGADGGGATDVRLIKETDWTKFEFNSIKSRIMVAAGGGGANYRVDGYGKGSGGNGGGLTGALGTKDGPISIDWGVYNTQATQTNAGVWYQTKVSNKSVASKFGYAFWGLSDFDIGWVQGGGGGGYYGGATGNHLGATGGSSFISGYNGCDAISAQSTVNKIIHTNQAIHYSGMVFEDTEMKAGNEVMPNPNGGTETGHNGGGVCIIIYPSPYKYPLTSGSSPAKRSVAPDMPFLR